MTPFEQQQKFLELVREGPGYLAFKSFDGRFKQ